MGNESGSVQETAPRRVGCLSRWLYILIVGVLIFSFAAGGTYLLWVQPTAEENRSLTAELELARAELEELRPLVAENEALQAEVEQAGLRLLVLAALVDVNSARVGLALGDSEAAAETLDPIASRLSAIQSRLEGEAAQSVGAMLDRLILVRNEIEADTFAALGDLEILASDLSQLAEGLEGD
jgi:hypothetical protein